MLKSNSEDGVVVRSILRVAGLALVSWAAVACGPAAAQQAPSSLTSPTVTFAYLPPKSPKYVPMIDRLKSFRVLEQLSEFLSPLRLPHRFTLSTKECGFVNAQYVPSRWGIELCYEFVETLERVGPKQGETSEFSYEEVVVGALVGVLLHEGGHAVFDMLDVPVFGREEDAADEMSTFIALQFSKEVAQAIVRGYSYLTKDWFGLQAPLYSDEHGTGLQRYYNTLCIAYGGAPDLFKPFVDKTDMPKARLANCPNEYRQVQRAFEKTVLPFVDVEKMKKVQATAWLQLTPAQVAALKERQRQQQQTFTFSACNMSRGTNVSLALMGQESADPRSSRVLGWFSLPDGGCNYIGTFFGEKIYYYAQSSNNLVWSAPDTDRTASKQCIDKVKAFEQPAGARCNQGQVQVNFRLRTLNPADFGVTLRLN
jgi:Putative metallopeptidase